MSNDQVREEFEVWVKTQEWYFGPACESLNRCDEQPDDYLCGAVHGAWLAWQASRAAVVVELPRLNPEMFQVDVVFGHEKAREEACRAIEAAGLKVKP